VPENSLPPEVERFIARYISSVEELEILLLLRRRRESWTDESVARELRVDRGSAARRLEGLNEQRLVERQGTAFNYSLVGDLDRDVEALARCYAERRVSVITFIFSQPTDRLKSFADAFRFKGGR
jgi:DNA-binding IclR family transcriptional regulator